MKRPFVTLEQLQEIVKQYPTPFHLYDEKGIRETARGLYRAFSWNPGFKEYFAVKATPNPPNSEAPAGGGLWRGLLLPHRADDEPAVWLCRGRDHVFFQ